MIQSPQRLKARALGAGLAGSGCAMHAGREGRNIADVAAGGMAQTVMVRGAARAVESRFHTIRIFVLTSQSEIFHRTGHLFLSNYFL